MKGLNLNAIQTYLTFGIGAATWAMLQLGCTQGPTGDMSCANAMIEPKWGGIIIGGLTVAKLVLSAVSPGGLINNWFAPKAPVTPEPVPGTVSPSDVKK